MHILQLRSVIYWCDLVPTWIDQPVGCGKAGRELRPRRWERNLKTRLLRPAQTPSPLQRRTAQASLSLSPPRQLLSWTISGSRNVRLSLRLSQMSHVISKSEEILNEKRRRYQNVFILVIVLMKYVVTKPRVPYHVDACSVKPFPQAQGIFWSPQND